MTAIDFFFDLSSPYSYLAETQLAGLAERTGVEVIYRPMVLAAVFKETHNYAPIECPPKARYMGRDLYRWAERYQVEFQFSSHFPVNAMSAMRLILTAGENQKRQAISHRLFRAVWAENRDVTNPSELSAIACELGLSVGSLAAIQDPEVKLTLRRNTEEAVQRGAFGAPTFFVRQEMFCGNDRLDLVEQEIQRQKP